MGKTTTSYRIKNPEGLYYLTFSTVGWVDIFTRKVYRDIIIDSMQYCIKEKVLRLFSYVIMSNHIHMICAAKEGIKLSDIIRDLKKYTSKQIIKAILDEPESRREWMLVIFSKAGSSNPNNKTYQVWRQDNHPIELYTNEVIDQKMEYIHMNPVRAGIVQNPEDYLYSSARNYAEMENILDIEMI
jgi:REP element-mobilizing transposase RayT